MTDLVVGCPVRKRAWIMDEWFTHVECAAAELLMTPTYVFVVDLKDTETVEVILARTSGQGRGVALIPAEEDQREDVRVWNEDRYRHMVYLRNLLLKEVRTIGPRYFWSVDSDILVHYQSLALAVSALDRFDAVGSKTYLTEGLDTRCPNWATYTAAGGLQRQDVVGATMPVGVIMAIKLMTPAAYNVNYEWNHQGEDIGWSLAAKSQGLKLGWDARTVSKHVMRPDLLYKADPRCEY